MNSMMRKVDEVKGSVEQVMHALNNLLPSQYEDHKSPLREAAHAKNLGIRVDGNPLLGFIMGYKPTEANVAQP